jgi:hypothetical protein
MISLPRYVSGDGPPYRPAAVIWLELESGLIVGMEAMRPEAALGRAAELFHRQAVRNIDGALRFGLTIPRRQRPFVESSWPTAIRVLSAGEC